jgi:arylformamidase
MAFDNLEPQPPARTAIVADYIERAVALGRAAVERVDARFDIAYGPEPRHQLDIYLPKGRTLNDAPVLLFIHGGRWRAGYKEWNALMAPAVTAFPAILVSARYGLSPEVRFPAPLHDVLGALGWLHNNIADYGGDPNRLFVGGHSAGGHLSALATVRRDLHAEFGLPTEAIRGCFPMSGTMTFDFDEVLPGSEEEEVRKILLADEAQAPEASPLHYAEGTKTPFFISYGEHDFPRVIATSKDMTAALEAQPCRLGSLVFAGAGHFDTHIDLAEPSSRWYETVRPWMAEL